MNSLVWFAFIFLANVGGGKSSPEKSKQMLAYQEIKSTIDDLNYELNRYKIELEILQEKVARLEESKSSPSTATLSDKGSSFEKRLSKLEEKEEAIISDLKNLAKSIKESEKTLTELGSLKGSLRSTIAILEGKSEVGSGEEYTVKKGDSLDRIASNFHTTVKALKEQNQLKGTTIFPGQKLIIP